MINSKEVKRTFNELANLNEENVKVKIVVELFKGLGYNFSSFNFEHPVYHKDKRIDFVIDISPNRVLYVETKRGDRDLTGKDIVQLASYLYIRSIEWGVLCNGRRLILLNNRIQPISNDEESLEDQIVFNLDLFSSRDFEYLRFVNKNSLFDTSVTNYFRDVSQYRAYKFPLGRGSWSIYRSTLLNFFSFYAEKEKKYRPLEQIRTDDFEEFLKLDQKQKEKQKKSVNSEETFNNKYSHLRSMFIELKKNKKITSHHFEEDRSKLIKNLETAQISKSADGFNVERIQAIVNFLKDSENKIRDTTILFLCLFLGLERSNIKSLQWNMFNKQRTILDIYSRKIHLPERLTYYLKMLEEENMKKGIRGAHLFYTKYRKKFNAFNDNTINEIFDKLKRIDENDPHWGHYSPQFIRTNLYKALFYSGYSIEEISFLTGADLLSLSKIFTNEDIITKVKDIKQNQIEKHPFRFILS